MQHVGADPADSALIRTIRGIIRPPSRGPIPARINTPRNPPPKSGTSDVEKGNRIRLYPGRPRAPLPPLERREKERKRERGGAFSPLSDRGPGIKERAGVGGKGSVRCGVCAGDEKVPGGVRRRGDAGPLCCSGRVGDLWAVRSLNATLPEGRADPGHTMQGTAKPLVASWVSFTPDTTRRYAETPAMPRPKTSRARPPPSHGPRHRRKRIRRRRLAIHADATPSGTVGESPDVTEARGH